MPLGPADQVNPIPEVETGVAASLAGGDGSASVVAATIVDIGETFPSVSTASTPK
jgi:hypothetical protein